MLPFGMVFSICAVINNTNENHEGWNGTCNIDLFNHFSMAVRYCSHTCVTHENNRTLLQQ